MVDNGYLFVFVLDYYRHSLINEDVEQQMGRHLSQLRAYY